MDNSLDACEEAEVLPDIWVSITKLTKETIRIAVEDNGPGIIPDNVPPYVFGKLLYGSRFHQIRQSRGQQGIGISAAVLFAQLTTGVPARVISRTGADKPAYLFDLMIRTEKMNRKSSEKRNMTGTGHTAPESSWNLPAHLLPNADSLIT